LLVEGIGKALIQSDALKMYICNVATQPGETDGYDVAAHVAALVEHLPGHLNPLDVVLAASQRAEVDDLDVGVSLVTTLPQSGIEVHDVVRDDHPLRHDPDKLAAVVMRIFEEQRHSRSLNGALRH
jgi:2-phospho-L-lactate transferase/gluconeogenesis factor (CofD/UPF0052 family)